MKRDFRLVVRGVARNMVAILNGSGMLLSNLCVFIFISYFCVAKLISVCCICEILNLHRSSENLLKVCFHVCNFPLLVQLMRYL